MIIEYEKVDIDELRREHPDTKRVLEGSPKSLKHRLIATVARGEHDDAEGIRNELRQQTTWKLAQGNRFSKQEESYAVWVENGQIVEHIELKEAG